MKTATVKALVPGPLRGPMRAGYRALMRGLCAALDTWEGGSRLSEDGLAYPAASLRYRVHGSPYLRAFTMAGRQNSQGVLDVLARNGIDFAAMRDVLDFGSGCGSTLRWLRAYSDRVSLHGTDVDLEAIAWCRRHLPFVRATTNSERPPLPFSRGKFDLIWAISVFTHLDEEMQFAWLSELQRIVKPGGIVLVTVLGHHHWRNLPPGDRSTLESVGFLFRRDEKMKGLLPDWYQTAYHSRPYVETAFRRFFDVIDYVPRGIGDSHDVVVLRGKR